RQKFIIEFAPEFRVLFRRPLVQQEDRALFEQADDKGKPPALAAGKIERAEFSVHEAGFLGQTELPQQTVKFAGLRLGNSIELTEEVIVEKDRRHQRTVGVARIVVDQPPIETDFAGIRRV